MEVSVEPLTNLQLVSYFRKFGERLLLVDELLPVEVTEPLAVEPDPEVGPEYSLPSQPEKNCSVAEFADLSVTKLDNLSVTKNFCFFL